MEKEDSWKESIEEVSHFLKKIHAFLACGSCQLDTQRRRKDENPLDSNSTMNTILDLNYNVEDIRDEVLSLTTRNYVETVKDKEREDNKHYRIFAKKINNREIYIKLKICDLNRIHLISFHYANWDMEDRPYK